MSHNNLLGRGKVRQPGFFKALGLGFRCAHPHWRLCVLQVKMSYQPLTRGIGVEIGSGMRGLSENFGIDAPGTSPFQEY
ncbi:MAG: hypothetical protein AAFP88_01790 [Bacteroidota bacterium]